MIRSALQAILSKLLSKYVENLHVNDLLYPSMCGFVTGAGSGYASNKSSPSIHLKHVKLRNGTVIYNTTADNSQKEEQTSEYSRGSIVLKLGEGGYIGSLKVGMEGSEYCVTVEDAVIVLELIIDEITPEGSDRHANVDEQSSMKSSADQTVITKNIESDAPLHLLNLANESSSKSAPSASVSETATSSTSTSFVETIDSISRTLAALPRIKIINCQVHLNIFFIMAQVACEKPRQQYAFIQAGIGSFTISLPEFVENETEITEQGEVKTQPMVVRHFKLSDGGFWIKIQKIRDNGNASPSKVRSHKRSPSSRNFHTAENLSSFASNSTSNSLWACDRWDAATSSCSNADSTSIPMIIFFKCPSFQMSTKWEYAMFRTINGTIEEYIYEHTIDYPMLFDYQSIQQSSSTVEENGYDRHHQEQHGSGMIIRLSITKHVELNIDKEILDVIGALVTAASNANKTRNEERNDPSPLRQNSSRRLLLGKNDDMRDQNRLELKASGGAKATSPSSNCTIDLHVSKIILRIQQCPLADTSSRFSSLYSFSFWNFNMNSLSFKFKLRLQNCREKEVVVTMECTVRKIALNKFIGAQPKQMLFTVEGVGGVDSSTLMVDPRYDPWDSKSACSIQHSSNTSEAAIHSFLWFAIPSPSTHKSTAMHLSVLIGSVTASLSSVLVQELTETLGGVERSVFQVKEIGHHRVVRREHDEYIVKRSRKVEQDRLETIVINYDLKIGCASILWDDKIQMKLESAFLKGCKAYPDSDNVQMFLKSLLDSITIYVGWSVRCSESRKSLGSLPDGVRMLVLLYVGDETTGLEQALNVPSDTNRLMHMINLNQRLSLI